MKKLGALILFIIIVVGIAFGISRLSKPSSSSNSQLANTTVTTLGKPGEFTCIKGSMTSSGSTALAPLVQAVAKKYQEKCSGASITVNLGGSGTGLANVENGSSDIGNSDIYAKTGQKDLVDHQVAVVAFVMLVNSKVTVTNLTTDQLKDIYSGKVTNWKDVGGADLPIVVVSRPTSSGTRATFQKYVLGTPETVSGPASLTTDSTGTVVKNVQQTDGAIGYAASGPAKKSGLSILKIDTVDPTPANVEKNSYKFWNIEHMYTKGKAKPLAQALIDYMLSNDGKAAAASLDFLPISSVPQNILKTHQNH
ncbi:MAG: PstS family phosphate ABC transporter substrate-binding protein [Candidatus Levyibacteriota bacterium]